MTRRKARLAGKMQSRGDLRCHTIVRTFWTNTVNLHCPDDASATKRAGRLADGHEVQLWRLVAELKFDDPQHRPKRRRGARAPMH